jgi:hypothetical protein
MVRGRRVWAAQVAIDHYRKAKDGPRAVADEADFRDLLCDLMHYARREGIDFDNEMRIARDHFDVETGA